MPGGAPPESHYLVGRSLDCDVLVSSPRVSARHAELRVSGFAGWVRDLGSRYGTTLNGRPVNDWVSFGPDDRLMVGNSELLIDGEGLRVNPARPGASVCAAGLGVAVHRGRKQLLRSVSFVAEPGEFVGLMGLSGAGKSTLLKAIVGLIEPSWGTVLINGVNLAADPDRARLAVGYVPQDDIVHSDLTVREALRYGATMRLPQDTTPDEIESRIAVVMNELGIGHTADTLIGSAERQGISGGQRKRVNLALELLPQPPLLLLDEPTSGLSSEDAGTVFALLRQLADEGHTIIVTTHQPALSDFKKFDRVIYLSDGELVYFGPAWPDSAAWFASQQGPEDGAGTSHAASAAAGDDAGQALARLSELKRSGITARALSERYEASSLHARFVAERMGEQSPDPGGTSVRQPPRLHDTLQHLRNQTARYVRLKLRNRGSLPIQLAQAPTVAVLVNQVFGTGDQAPPNPILPSKLVNIAFFMAIASVWFGCSNAAREIVGERPIFVRERMVGLGLAPYLLSKLGVLGVLSAVQCMLLLGITSYWQGLPGAPFQQFGLLWLCAMIGVLMGLMLSAVSRSSEAALSATPLLLIPEILLAGLIVPVYTLPRGAKQLANVAATRWGFEALLHCYDPLVPEARLGTTLALQFGDAPVGLEGDSWRLAALALVYLTLLTLSLSGNPRRFA